MGIVDILIFCNEISAYFYCRSNTFFGTNVDALRSGFGFTRVADGKSMVWHIVDYNQSVSLFFSRQKRRHPLFAQHLDCLYFFRNNFGFRECSFRQILDCTMRYPQNGSTGIFLNLPVSTNDTHRDDSMVPKQKICRQISMAVDNSAHRRILSFCRLFLLLRYQHPRSFDCSNFGDPTKQCHHFVPRWRSHF